MKKGDLVMAFGDAEHQTSPIGVVEIVEVIREYAKMFYCAVKYPDREGVFNLFIKKQKNGKD